MKKILIALSLLLIVGIFIGGFVVKQHEEKQRMIEIATSDEAKEVYEEKIKKRVPKAFTNSGAIISYDVNKDSLQYNPMGGLMVQIIVNNNPKLYMNFNLISESESYHTTYYGVSPELSKKNRRGSEQ